MMRMLCGAGLSFGFFLVAAVAARGAPLIVSFRQDGFLSWSNVIPGHAYNVVRETVLGGTQETVHATVVPGASVITRSVPMDAPSGFFRVIDTGVQATASNAVNIGLVSGDTGAQTTSWNGYGDAFSTVAVREDNFDFLSLVPLSVRFRLNSPPGMDYDLYVYSGGVLIGSSANSGSASDSLQLQWGDESLFDPADDTRTYVIEVRRWSGTSFGYWSLEVLGNPL